MASKGIDVLVVGFVRDGRRKLFVLDAGDGNHYLAEPGSSRESPGEIIGRVVNKIAYSHLSASPRLIGRVTSYPHAKLVVWHAAFSEEREIPKNIEEKRTKRPYE